MLTLDLVRVTDTYGHVTGEKGKVIYQALTDDEWDNLMNMHSGYSYIGRDFDINILGQVQIPSIDNEEDGVANA